MIEANDLVGKFQYALDNDWGYIWGTAGVEWTAKKQAQLEKTTDEKRANSRKYGKQWIGHYVSDCSGMFCWAFKAFGLPMSHISSNIYKSYCTANKGQLTADLKQTIPAGCAVFTGQTAGNHPHVGLYIGGGEVIEAAGAKSGVIKSKITDKKWTFYGQLKDVNYADCGIGDPAYYERPSTGTVQAPAAASHPTLRHGSKGEAVIELQSALVKLGYGLGPCGIDGDYGRATKAAVEEFQLKYHVDPVDGICGPKTWAAIENALATPAEPIVITYTVTIPGLDLEQAKAIAAEHPGAEIVEGSVNR